MSTIRVVSCCAGDAAVVQQCLGGQRGAAEAEQLPHRVYAAVAWDEESGAPAGYLSLDDAPTVCNKDTTQGEHAAAAAAAADGLGYKQSGTLYVQQLQAQEGPVLQQLLRHAFVTMPHLKQVVLVSSLDFDADIQQQQEQKQQQQLPAMPDAAVTLFAKAAHIRESSAWLYECSRQAALPPLQVRYARVEDHDDLLPIVAAAAAGPCPSLATLPQCCQPDEPFALTRLINSKDSQNLVLVAEEDGNLVGLLVATLQLDARLLIQAFDLGFCDAFMPAEVYEECEAAAKHAAAEKAAAQQTAGTSEEPSTAPAAPTADQIQEELMPLLLAAFARRKKQQQRPTIGVEPAAPHNLAAITMLCMQAGYEDRAIDFMPALFTELPEQQYCALTLPHSAAQPEQLARHMTLLSPVPGCSFPQVVLLLHRAGLALHMGADWEVRLAVPDDVVALHQLMGSASNALEMQEAFLHAVGRQGAVVAAVNGELVAMLASDPCSPETLGSWSAQFRLGAALPCSCLQAPEQHAQVSACVINPVFAAQAGTLLAASLKLLGKTCLHYVLAPAQAAPAEVLAVMQQQRPRHHSSRFGSSAAGIGQQAAADASGAALFSFAKGMAHINKHIVNAQVVIAGASETGLSCLEHLLLQPNTRFTNVTLLAPGGLRTDGIAGQLTAERVSRLGLHANIAVVDSHLVALDAQQQLLMLADGASLPYDLLAVATGLQDQLGPAVAGAFPDAAQFVLSAQQLMASSITPDVAASLRSVLLYGAGLHAFDALATLIDAGVDADAMTWLCPDTEQAASSLALLRGLASQIGVELPEPQQGHVLELAPTADGARAVASLQALDAGEDGPLQQMDLDLLVGCGSLQPSAVVASCLAGAFVVWDGRLVVDAQFCSSDPNVVGAGPLAKFSRRYTLPEVRHEHYNSCELGVKLAEAMLGRFHSAYTTAQQRLTAEAVGEAAAQQQRADQLPALQQGKVVGCRLPGGQAFLWAGAAGTAAAAAASPGLAPPAGGCTLLSKGCSAGDQACVLAMVLDEGSRLQQVAFVGSVDTPEAAAARGLMGLVGLPFSYLAWGLSLPESLSEQLLLATQLQLDSDDSSGGGGEERVPAGVSPGPEPGVWVLERDVLAALQQPWAQLLLHEDFLVLREQLVACESGVEAATVVEFMQSCRGQLSGYRVPELQAGSAVC